MFLDLTMAEMTQPENVWIPAMPKAPAVLQGSPKQSQDSPQALAKTGQSSKPGTR